MAPRKVSRASLTSSQFQTILTEVAVVINSRPLINSGNELDNQITAPAHFLSINIRTGTPVLALKSKELRGKN